MLKGFIRTASCGPSKLDQEASLRDAGLSDFSELGPVYVDDRDAAIQSLVSDDVLVVADPSRLGVSTLDVMTALVAIGERGAAVMRADTKELLSWSPEAQRVVEFAVEADSTNRKIIAANARRALKESGKPRGKPAVVWNADKLALLKKLDQDGELTREQMAGQLGISRATLQRKLAELAANRDTDE